MEESKILSSQFYIIVGMLNLNLKGFEIRIFLFDLKFYFINKNTLNLINIPKIMIS